MATNQVLNHGDQFSVAAADVNAPASPESGDAVVIDQLPAVALTNVYTDTDGTNRITVKTNGVYEFAVNANNGAIEVGHVVHIHSTTGAVTNTATGGVRFGYALGAVASSATTVIPVKIGY
ncbi:DUF2190 family protein [Glycomyces tenuis]|uniref:DUF2190 family protein n=1 Tax=Glycomyces tenuis TaxID=58116 RepID=UPI00040FDF3E|nr:DUF2190 family protein [Glycomyces tenuis]